MINLMPPAMKKSIHYGRVNVILVHYCLLILTISIALSGVMFFGLTIIGSDKKKLEHSIEEKKATLAGLSDIQGDAKKLSQSIQAINSLLDKEIEFSTLLQEIGSTIPNGAFLTDLVVTGDVSQPLTIRANIDAQTTAAVLQKNLEDSDLFTGADIQSINTGQVDGAGNVISYSVDIVVQFAQDATEKLRSKQ